MSDIEMSWGIFVLAARWSAAFLSASPAVCCCRVPVPVVLSSLCRGSGTCFQPCLWFIREWIDVVDLEGLCGAFGALAAASVYMFHDLSKLAAAAALASAFASTVVLVGDLLCQVGAFTDPFALEIRAAAAIKELFCKKSMLAAAAHLFASMFSVALVGDSVFLVGAFADPSSLIAGSAASLGLSCLMRLVPAATSIALALSEVLVELAVPVGIFEFVGLVLSVPSAYLCLPHVDFSPNYDQGSGKHGIVSSLLVGLEQASGRVDVPDDAEFEAAAAIGRHSSFRAR